MKKQCAGAVTGLLLMMACATKAQQTMTLKGTIANISGVQKLYLTEDWTGTEMSDSIPVKNGKYSYVKKLSKPYPVLAIMYLTYADEKQHGKIVRKMITDFYEEKGTINIDINTLDWRDGATVTGSPANKDLLDYRKAKAGYLEDRQKRMEAAGDAWPKGQAANDEFREGMRKMLTDFVLARPRAFFSLSLLEYDLVPLSKPAQMLDLFEKLDPALQKSEKGIAVSGAIANSMKIKVNEMAPDFTEKDTAGVNVTLSSFRGQYVLLDFWASWCHPCRGESPYLVAAYKDFKDRNFTIISISLDNSRKAWIKAMHDDGYQWTQLSALDPQRSESVFRYGIKTIPRNMIIDPTGKVIAMDLRGKAIAEKLEEVLPKKS